MKNLIIKENVKIEDMIYEIRGKQVIIAGDVARLYQVETKRINEVVKRNISRFPSDFCFQLNQKEINDLSLRSHFATLNKNNNLRGQHFKYLPYVFTEHGVMMLSSLLKSDIAIKVNIDIINAFIKMKRYLSNSLINQDYYNNMIVKHDAEIKLLQDSFEKLNNKEINNHIFFEGQIYDAYSLMKDILGLSKESIIIIDNYVDKKLLDILANVNKEIMLITHKYNNEDYNKYNKKYKNISLRIDNSFRDRFIIIDKKVLYHSGASFKDLGKKMFCINQNK